MAPEILAICSSPRKGGNTETLVKTALEAAEAEGARTRFISLRGKKINGCLSCFKCAEKKDEKCHGAKDDFGEIYEAIKKADGLILASPVYFAGPCSQIKAVIDRAGLVSKVNGNLLAGKAGGPIAAARRAGAVNTYAQLALFYPINGMTLVGSTYWNVGFGMQPGDVKGDDEGLQTMKNFGANLAKLLIKLSS